MKNKIEIIYEHPNKIYVKIDKKKLLLIDNNNKKISATDIYKTFDYKKGKIYELCSLTSYTNISDEYKSYLNDIHEMIENIISELK